MSADYIASSQKHIIWDTNTNSREVHVCMYDNDVWGTTCLENMLLYTYGGGVRNILFTKNLTVLGVCKLGGVNHSKIPLESRQQKRGALRDLDTARTFCSLEREREGCMHICMYV